jgi:hypothetical protein
MVLGTNARATGDEDDVCSLVDDGSSNFLALIANATA